MNVLAFNHHEEREERPKKKKQQKNMQSRRQSDCVVEPSKSHDPPPDKNGRHTDHDRDQKETVGERANGLNRQILLFSNQSVQQWFSCVQFRLKTPPLWGSRNQPSNPPPPPLYLHYLPRLSFVFRYFFFLSLPPFYNGWRRATETSVVFFLDVVTKFWRFRTRAKQFF